VQTIITKRLADVSAEGLLDTPALNLCAAKVTSSSGDLRQALDLCRCVLMARALASGYVCIFTMHDHNI